MCDVWVVVCQPFVKRIYDDNDDLYTAAYREARTAAVYNLKWRTDQH